MTRYSSRLRNAALVGAVLAFVSAAFVAPPVYAGSTVEYVDQSQTPPPGFGPQYEPDPATMVGQPVIPQSTGHVTKLTVAVDASRGVFSSAALHAADPGPLGAPLPAPLVGGVGVIDSDLSAATGTVDVTIIFPGRPHVTAGTRYVLVIDPQSPAGAASFALTFWAASPDVFVMHDLAGWAPIHTANMYLTVWMAAPITVTPLPPAYATTACGVVPALVLPTVAGVTYSTALEAGNVRVTATASAGYVLDFAAVSEWLLPVAVAAPCPTPTATPTVTPTPTATPTPNATPNPIVTPTPTPNPIVTPTPTATPTPTVTPTPTPSATATATPSVTPAPSATPTPLATETPAPAPIPESSASPTAAPTLPSGETGEPAPSPTRSAAESEPGPASLAESGGTFLPALAVVAVVMVVVGAGLASRRRLA